MKWIRTYPAVCVHGTMGFTDLLISEQQVTDTNPLLDLATIPPDLQAISPNSSSQPFVPSTHTAG